MTYKISLYGKGNELAIGSLSKDTWDYIQAEFSGNGWEYLDSLGNGDVPDEFQIAPDPCEMYECDDQAHHDGCWSNWFRLSVEDEDGNEVFSCTNDDIRAKGVQEETNYESIDDSVKYLSVWSSVAKGLYLTGEFEVEGKFDPTKLKVKYERTCWNHDDEYDEIVRGFEYDGEDIESEFDSSDGKGDTLKFIEVEQEEDDD